MTYKDWQKKLTKIYDLFDSVGKPYFKAPSVRTFSYSKNGPEQLENIYPAAYKGKVLDGLQLIVSHYKGKTTYEVSEYMAGPNENELHVFKRYKNPTSAVKLIRKIAKDKKKPKPIEVFK